MERELAERMLVALQSLNPGLDEAARIVQSMRNQEEAGLLRRHLGAVMADPLYEIVMHIVREYPDLDPDKTIDPGRKNDASVLHPLTESPPVVTDGCHRRLLRSRARVSAALLGSSSRGALGEHVDARTVSPLISRRRTGQDRPRACWPRVPTVASPAPDPCHTSRRATKVPHGFHPGHSRVA